ncbi:MAG: N-acetyl-alpha-D-glucosaminyl L-malate synthase BshA [Bacteroidia bacterium]|nr:N-acetyl-alpha-D-glucosaminyl L-malate synthase BshA [Bacteroidia bacterium]MCZ2140172.1 N-acetyl-alpha-D-glucosaminyl L-malate synthase BshA [Bacteroidia bacterium]
MKIGIVCYPTYGGSGVVATELGKALAERGHKIHFISYKQPARLDFFTNSLFYHEVYVNNYPLFEYPPYETTLSGRLVDVIKVEKLDVLHVHYAIPHASAAIFAKQILAAEGIHIPIVTTLHGTDITLVGKDASILPVITYAMNMSDALTSVSESLKNDTYKLFNVTKDIKVIPNFIDFDRFSKKSREHFRKAITTNNEKLLVHTSNFRKVKRVDDVVKTFALLEKQLPAKLLLVGDGPERQHIEILCREMGLWDKVIFLGKQDQVEEILSVCDLFLLPSGTESFGLAALEAMACEVPVISSNAGGIPELNIEGVTGYLCDVGDVTAMAEKAFKILSDNTTLKQFKANAKARALEFHISKILPQYESVYESVVNQAVK